MSLYSEHAQNVNRITAYTAALEADRLRRRGELVGGTIAMLGQVPGQIMDARAQQQHAQAVAEQAAQDRQHRLETDALNAEKTRSEISGHDADQFRAEHKARTEEAARRLGLATPDNYGAIRRSVIALRPDLDEALPNEFPPPEVMQGLQRALVGDLGKPPDAPKQPALITGYGPDGKTPTRVEDKAGVQTYVAPSKASTPNVGSFEDFVTRQYGDAPTAAQILAARKSYNQADDRGGAGGGLTGNAAADQANAKTVASGLKRFAETGEGTTPEVLLSSRATSIGMALQAELERSGVDTGKLVREWTAAKTAIRSLDSASQLRLVQTINKASASLDKLDELNAEWSKNAPRWGVKALNRASLKAAQNGAYGPEAASVAQRLDGQIADVTAELGQSIMGGNTPTDHALQLAAKNLSSDWTDQVLRDSIKQVRYNLNLAQSARNELLERLNVQGTQFQTPVPQATEPAATPPPGARIRTYDPATGTLR